MPIVSSINQPRRKTFLLSFIWAGVLSASLLMVGSIRADDAAELKGVSRKISKEPKYKTAPRYALMVLGVKDSGFVWMVEDGDTLYVDKNGNGDLTDDGPPIPQSNMRDLSAPGASPRRWDCNYHVDEIVTADGTKHTKFKLSRWNYGEKKDSYGLELTVNGRPMYAGWFGTFWSSAKETAPLLHLGGALRPDLLGHQDFVIGRKETDSRKLALSFINSGSGTGTDSRLSIESLVGAVPVMQIDWPVAAGAAPIQTTHRLTHRCCYWCFYDTVFDIPAGVITGTAKATVTLEGYADLNFSTRELEIPVRTQAEIKAENKK